MTRPTATPSTAARTDAQRVRTAPKSQGGVKLPPAATGASSGGPGPSLRFITPLPPSTNNAYATVSGRRVKTKVAREFTERVGDIVVAAKAVAGGVPAPPFALHLGVWFPDEGRRDISNTIKLLEDSLMRAIGADDRHVHLLIVQRKGVDRFAPRVVVVLDHMEPLATAEVDR